MKYQLGNLVFLILATVCGTAMADGLLRFNPFQQPSLLSEKSRDGRKAGNELKLRGTVVDAADSMVNIGGEFYRLNQMVAGYRVVRIESGKVTLHRGVNETVLILNDDMQKY